jgi:hypothetical protein
MSTCTSCGGTIEDGYCNVCGLAAAPVPAAASAGSASAPAGSASAGSGSGGSRQTSGTRSSRRTSGRSARGRLGAGLVEIPPVPGAPLVPGAPRLPGDLQLCPRVYPDDRYVVNAGFTVAEKTSVEIGTQAVRLPVAVVGMACAQVERQVDDGGDDDDGGHWSSSVWCCMMAASWSGVTLRCRWISSPGR